MTPKRAERIERETAKRLRAALCDEAAEGFDLDEHARNIASAVTVARRAAAVAEAKADLTPEEDLASDLQQVARARS